jgi:phosphatidylserine/phosphatidylglycerophosphate/cardiolipin synthase-like enzyme
VENQRWLLLIALLGGCDVPAEDDSPLPALDDDKADSAASLLKKIDVATHRVLLKVTSLPTAATKQHLVDAAQRGVDVELYLVMKNTGDGQTVLNEQGFEGSGVDTTVDHADRLPGYTSVVDQRVGANMSDADGEAAAFAMIVAEQAPAKPIHLTAGKVKVLPMPESTGAEIVAVIDGAAHTIDLEIYQLQDPAVVAALARAAKRGVTVRVMLEPQTVGAINYPVIAPQLTAAGIDVQPTPPAFDSGSLVDHAKFMIIDGSAVLFGSGNLVRSGLGGNPAQEFDNRDFWVEETRATEVAEVVKLFAADWARTQTSASSFPDLVLTPDNADTRLLALVDGAKSRLYVWNQSLSDPTMLSHLTAVAKRGVDVRVLLGMQPGFGGQPPKNQPAIDALVAAGAKATYLTRNYLHAKSIVADDELYIGSQNFSTSGLSKNRELGEIFADHGLAATAATLFASDEK